MQTQTAAVQLYSYCSCMVPWWPGWDTPAVLAYMTIDSLIFIQVLSTSSSRNAFPCSSTLLSDLLRSNPPPLPVGWYLGQYIDGCILNAEEWGSHHLCTDLGWMQWVRLWTCISCKLWSALVWEQQQLWFRPLHQSHMTKTFKTPYRILRDLAFRV